MFFAFTKPTVLGKSWRSFREGGNPQLIVAVGCISAFFGLFIAYFCYVTGYAAIYYLLALVLIILLPLIVMTRDDPTHFAFTALLVGLPVIPFIVPPGRLGVSIFDYSMLFVLLRELWSRATDRHVAHTPFFPTPVLMWIQILVIPVVLMAHFPGISTWVFVENLLIYTFFLVVLREIQTTGGGERLLFLFSIAVIVLAIGVLFEKITNINLSMSGANLNRSAYAAGVLVNRASGFFQDPQKAAQFFSCAGVLLFPIGLGHRFTRSGIRFTVWLASLVAFFAVFLTASRSALIAGFILIPFIILLGTRGGALVKLSSIFVVSVMLFVVFLLPTEALVGMLPIEVASRLGNLDESLFFRIHIWFDTWDMFADQPITGIGLGGFRSYLLAKNPAMQNYMGIGGPLGIGYVPDQPESGFFKILYEGGVLGSLASLLLIYSVFRRALLVMFAPDALPEWRAEVIGALAALLVFGLTFVTLFTLSDERNVVVLVLPLAIIWARSMALNPGSDRPVHVSQ